MSPVWTIKIKSETDFSTVLANGVQFQEAGFLQSLSDPGNGSIQIPVNNSVFAAPLPGAQITPLIDQECIYEFYQDGVWRFGFFAEDVVDNLLPEGSDTLVHQISGRGLAASLEWAFALPQGWPTLTTEDKRVFTATSRMKVWHVLFTEAKTAGFIPHITVDFTATVDSAGVAWAETDDFEVPVGKDLLSLLVEFASAAGVEWQMGQNFVLSAKQDWGTDRSSTIKMYSGRHQQEHKRQRSRKELYNDIYVRASDGTIGHVSDAPSQAKWRKRARMIDVGSAASVSSATLVGTVNLEQLRNEIDSRTLKVLPNEPGRVVYQDYNPMGDTLSFVTGTETLAQRCVAAAIKLSNDGRTDLELTLQFLISPPIVRQNRLANRLGGNTVPTPNASPAGITQKYIQDHVADIVDDAIDDHVNTTIPAQVVVSSASPLVYQSERHNDVRAAVQLVWSQPPNSDLSTISDGDHYEVRWQLSQVYSAPITWDQAGAYTWDQLLTWDRPISITYADNPVWHTMNVPWDTTTVLIQELMADSDYKFQVRAVDTFANVGPWSTVQNVATIGDLIAPSQPKPPIVSSGLIGIQVQHNLGKEGFGDFTLEPDLDHLDVHVGPSAAFSPSDSNRVGSLVANAGLIQGLIPAVATFKIDQIGGIWVKVVAVDRYGNKSGASFGAQSTSVLIDDAHISDLTVSKVTAGTLSAAVILSGSIKTATSGARVELTFAGIEVYDQFNRKTLDVDSATGDVVMAGIFKTGLTGQRVEIADAAPYSTMYFYGNSTPYAFINAVEMNPVNSDPSIGLGINAGSWNANTETRQINSRVWVRDAISVEIIDNTQTRYGGYLYVDETQFDLAWYRGASGANQGSQVIGYRDAMYLAGGDSTGGNGYLELAAGRGAGRAVIAMNYDGQIDVYGKFRNYADTGTYQGLFTGVLLFTSAAAFTVSYGTTKNGTVAPIYSIRNGSAIAHACSTFDNTGFTVTLATTATVYVMFWCYRTG